MGSFAGALGSAMGSYSGTRKQIEKDDQNEINSRNIANALGRKAGSGDSTGSNDIGEVQGQARKGGKIRKTGLYMVHKGEIIVPSKVVKRSVSRKKPRNSGRR